MFNFINIVRALYPHYKTMMERGFKTTSIHHDFIEHGVTCSVFEIDELIFEAEELEDLRHNNCSEGLADLVALFLKEKAQPQEGQLYGGDFSDSDINFFWKELQNSKFAQKCKKLYSLEEEELYSLIKEIEFEKKVKFYEEFIAMT